MQEPRDSSCAHRNTDRGSGPDLPLLARDGGFIAPGWNAGLDELRTLRDQSRRLMVSLQNTYAYKTGVESEKLNTTTCWGVLCRSTDQTGRCAVATNGPFYSPSNHVQRGALLHCGTFRPRKSNSGAGDKALALECELFQMLVDRILQNSDAIAKASVALATLDVLSGLAEQPLHTAMCAPR